MTGEIVRNNCYGINKTHNMDRTKKKVDSGKIFLKNKQIAKKL